MSRRLAGGVCLAALLTAAASCAQPVVSPTYVAIYGRSPVVTQYIPNGILTTPTFSPQIAAGSLSNSATFVLFAEFRCLPGTTSLAPDNYQGCNNSITLGNFLDAAGDAEHNPGANFIAQDSYSIGGTSRWNINNCTGGNNNSTLGAWGGINAVYADGKMHTILAYVDMSQASGTDIRAGAVYVDSVPVVSGFTDQGTFTGTKTVCFNSNNFYLNGFNGTQAAKNVEFGRFYLYINPPSSPVQTGTNLPSFDITKFGTPSKPVDFGPTGANPLGTAPTVFFCNPAATYLTNCGTGPNATAQQQVTSAATKKAYDSAIRPGEVPDRPWVKGHYNVTWNTLACISTALTCTAGTNGGWAVDVGDLDCWVVDIGNTADAANDAFAMAGYTNVTGSTVVGTGLATSSNYNINMTMFCKTYAGTPVPSGGTIATPTFTWNDNSGGMGPFGGFQVEGNITHITFGKYGPSGKTPTIVAAAGLGGPNGTTTLPFADVVAPAGKSLWVGIQADSQWAASPSLGAVGPPATGTLVVGAAPLVQNNAPTIYVEKLSAAATISRTAAGNPGNPTASISVILN